MSQAVKLRCEDEEDIVVLSSLLQDALVPMEDIAWLPQERRFVFVAGRFVWEECLDVTLPPDRATVAGYSRRNFGVAFEAVTGVKSRGIDLGARGRILELLAVGAEPGVGSTAIEFVFAGGACIRLEAERILAHGQDLGEAWPTQWRPRHPGVEAA
ncbi:MAG: DUF2948 family protein [Rhodospirillaceae bacterium]|nr:DUF2948 family protein [Rhodospirillaceae bacterium]